MADGTIKQVIGPTVDVEFHSDSLPAIFNALRIPRKDEEDLIVEVASHIGNNQVRCVSMDSTDGLVRNMKVIDTGGPITVPVGDQVLGRMFNLLGQPIDGLGDIKDVNK